MTAPRQPTFDAIAETIAGDKRFVLSPADEHLVLPEL
jgi:hypothetical protein